MDLRRERQRGNHLVGLLIVLVFCAIGAVIMVWFGQNRATPAMTFPAVEHGDLRAVALSKKELRNKAKNETGDFSYTINASPTFSDSLAEGDVGIKNPVANQHWMAVEIALDDTNEVVFRSGYIQPGQQIPTAVLDLPIEKGSYQATAYIGAIDRTDQTVLGVLEQTVTLTIKK